MSLAEARTWVEYRNLRGSLNVGRRVEQVMAEMKLIAVKVAGDKRSRLKDFLHYEEPLTNEPERVATPQDIIRMMTYTPPARKVNSARR